MTAAVQSATSAKPAAAKSKDAKPTKDAKAGAAAANAEDESEEVGGRIRPTYFIATGVRELGSKRDATKYLEEHGLKDGEEIIKGRAATYEPVEVYELD